MEEEGAFNSVTWERDEQPPEQTEDSTPSPPRNDATLPIRSTSQSKRTQSNHDESQAGPQADGVDLAGVGDGVLDCTVDTPLKENEGTNEAYVSYLVTTNVRLNWHCTILQLTYT